MAGLLFVVMSPGGAGADRSDENGIGRRRNSGESSARPYLSSYDAGGCTHRVGPATSRAGVGGPMTVTPVVVANGPTTLTVGTPLAESIAVAGLFTWVVDLSNGVFPSDVFVLTVTRIVTFWRQRDAGRADDGLGDARLTSV